jgi:hypothetical protein
MMYGVEMGSGATTLVYIPCLINNDFAIQRFIRGRGICRYRDSNIQTASRSHKPTSVCFKQGKVG